MVTEQENKLRNIFFNEKGMKAYEGHINNSDKVVWKEEYVKWLESKLSQTPISGRSELLKCPQCGCTETSSHSEGIICNNCKYVAWAF